MNDYYTLLGYISTQPKEVQEKVNEYVAKLEEILADGSTEAHLAYALVGMKLSMEEKT